MATSFSWTGWEQSSPCPPEVEGTGQALSLQSSQVSSLKAGVLALSSFNFSQVAPGRQSLHFSFLSCQGSLVSGRGDSRVRGLAVGQLISFLEIET